MYTEKIILRFFSLLRFPLGFIQRNRETERKKERKKESVSERMRKLERSEGIKERELEHRRMTRESPFEYVQINAGRVLVRFAYQEHYTTASNAI